jgi:hypothetical protein
MTREAWLNFLRRRLRAITTMTPRGGQSLRFGFAGRKKSLNSLLNTA